MIFFATIFLWLAKKHLEVITCKKLTAGQIWRSRWQILCGIFDTHALVLACLDQSNLVILSIPCHLVSHQMIWLGDFPVGKLQLFGQANRPGSQFGVACTFTISARTWHLGMRGRPSRHGSIMIEFIPLPNGHVCPRWTILCSILHLSFLLKCAHPKVFVPGQLELRERDESKQIWNKPNEWFLPLFNFSKQKQLWWTLFQISCVTLCVELSAGRSFARTRCFLRIRWAANFLSMKETVAKQGHSGLLERLTCLPLYFRLRDVEAISSVLRSEVASKHKSAVAN